MSHQYHIFHLFARARTMASVIRGDIQALQPGIKAVLLGTVVYMIGWGFADPFFSLYLSEFSDDYTHIGLLSSLMNVVSLLFMLFLAELVERASHRNILTISKLSYVVIGLCYFIAGEMGSMHLLIIAIVLNGLASAAVWVTSGTTLRAIAKKKEVNLTFGLYVTVRNLSMAIGIGVALLYVARMPIHYIFVPVILLAPLSAIFTRKIEHVNDQSILAATRDIFIKDKVVVRFWRELRTFRREIWWPFLLRFIHFSIHIFTFTFFPLYLESKGYSLLWIGFFIFLILLPYFFSFLAAEIANRYERLLNVVIGFSIAAVAIIGCALWNDSFAQIACWGVLLTAGASVVSPSLSGMVTILSPRECSGTATVMMMYMVMGSTAVLSPLFGWLIDTYGWNTTFLSIGIGYACMAILVSFLRYYFHRGNRLYHLNHPDSKKEPYVL